MTAPKGKYLLKGCVENITPLHIGSGNDNDSDMDILRNSDGIPFIPATSFVGILLHLIGSSVPDEIRNQDAWKWFWGYSEERDVEKEKKVMGYGSRFQCSDLNMIFQDSELFSVVIRDGLKIDNTRNMAVDKGKFDYELLESGSRFDLNIELSYEDSDKKFVEKMIHTIISCATGSGICIGKMTNAGFGQIHLVPDSITLYHFDFREKSDALAWLYQDFSKKRATSIQTLPAQYEFQSTVFRIKAKFKLKHSMIIRSYSADPNDPDAVHLKCGNRHIIPGTSLKGAIRARAERIANTINPSKTKQLMDELFGMVDPGQPETRAKKGKVKIREVVLTDYLSEKQTRIQIDRFTGGVIDGKLFETMPIFSNNDSHGFEVEMTVPVSNSSQGNEDVGLGLLLLVLKDLWSGDLAVGGEKNVGRGVFKGIEATIHYKGEKLIIPEDIKRINESHKIRLQGFVEEFNKWMKS